MLPPGFQRSFDKDFMEFSMLHCLRVQLLSGLDCQRRLPAQEWV